MTPDLRAGERLGRYRIRGRIGRGAMGTVYLAEDPEGRRAALKVITAPAPALSGSMQAAARLEREAEALARLDHPNVVGALGPPERAGDLLFFPMELVLGRNLAQVLAATGPLAPERAAAALAGVLAGLEAAHRAGIVHRDLIGRRERRTNIAKAMSGGLESGRVLAFPRPLSLALSPRPLLPRGMERLPLPLRPVLRLHRLPCRPAGCYNSGVEPCVYKFDPGEDTEDIERRLRLRHLLDLSVEERYRRFFEACAFAEEMLKARAPETRKPPGIVKRG